MDYKLLQPALARAGGDAGALIGVLQEAQEVFGYLPMEVLEYIASQMGLAVAKVLGVATFYAQFRTAPVGKHLIMLCQGTACHVNGSGRVEEIISEYLGICENEISSDGLFSYTNVACLGCCSLAPAMMIDEKVYGHLDSDKIKAIFEEIRANEGAGYR
ncbi:MAG: NAD(P)H-dependent oxidoreductase subunit E [Defluviitaleaceae bacterium]|nr:NAD(P)H-dependent oxidoreductase subunit E [Defluviitaleaceae bacterium]